MATDRTTEANLVAAKLGGLPTADEGRSRRQARPRNALIALGVLASGYFIVTRVDRAIACLVKSNEQIAQANDQLSLTNRHIAEMQQKLGEMSRKLDDTNKNLTSTNLKFNETNTRLLTLNQMFQRFPIFHK